MDTLNIHSSNLWVWFTCLLIIRYFVSAGIPYLICYQWKRSALGHLKIQKTFPKKLQLVQEIGFSLITLFIYSLSIWLFEYWITSGHTKHYALIDTFGAAYFVISIVVMIALHDTYFYWTHRLFHTKALFRHIHLIHHKFKNPTPFAAFAFHPLESILSMGIIPIIIFIMPWHPIALMLFITIMTFYDAFIHLGYNFKKISLFKWQNTPVEHDWHHNHSNGNYGLYFTVWDRVMGTYYNQCSTSKSRIV